MKYSLTQLLLMRCAACLQHLEKKVQNSLSLGMLARLDK